jgi:Fe-Mn family superoxide dismutase
MYTLPNLPYPYDALSPVISKDIMELHHSEHHQVYVDKLNRALEGFPELQGKSLVELLTAIDALPEPVRSSIRNNGGGHYSHSLFWQCMAPNSESFPGGSFGEALIAKYGSFDNFTAQFNAAAIGLFGSGWVWLTRELEIITLPNQDTPMALGKGEPLMGLDVWEHAYYLDYKNRRDEYIQNWWQVVNWSFIEARYNEQ